MNSKVVLGNQEPIPVLLLANKVRLPPLLCLFNFDFKIYI